MGKGSSAPTTQYVKTETSSLPEYAKPYYEGLMASAEGMLSRPYTPYGQERIAGFTPQQTTVQNNILNQQRPGQFGTATGLGTAAGLGSLMAADYNPSQFSSQQAGVGPLSMYQMGGPQQFGSAQAQQYMSPYIQNVIDVQKDHAIRDAQKTQLASDLGAARQGTYGGSRQLLASLERERNLGHQLSDIDFNGLQSAYQNAQQQFNADQTAQQAANQQNLQAALGVQQLGTQSGLQAALANQQNWLQTQQAAEQSRQFGASQGLQGLSQAGQMAQTLSNIGQVQGQTDLALLNQQQQTAAQQQALNQQYLDTAYQDFLRQRDYPLEMLQQYSSLLRGVPVTPSSTSTTYAPAPSVASQILGTGLGALGLYNSLGKTGS